MIFIYVLFDVRKDLFEAFHNFIHLNLAVALLLGYLLFLGGIDTATGNTVSYHVVDEIKFLTCVCVCVCVCVCLCTCMYVYVHMCTPGSFILP